MALVPKFGEVAPTSRLISPPASVVLTELMRSTSTSIASPVPVSKSVIVPMPD